MANYQKHLLGGTIAFGVVCYFLRAYNPSLLTLIEWGLCSLMGGLFPDVDIKSKGQKYFYTILFVTFILLVGRRKFFLVSCMSIVAIIPLLTRHRGLFHNIFFVILFPFSVWFILSLWHPQYAKVLLNHVLFFVAGQVSHLVLDFGCIGIVHQICGYDPLIFGKNKRKFQFRKK